MVGQFTRKDFLDAVFSQYYREHRGFILVKTMKVDEGKADTRYFPNIDGLGREIYAEDRDVYFGVCPRERMKPEKEHAKYIIALWADMDIGPDAHKKTENFFPGAEETARAMRDFPVPPSITVDSGHGLHLYWLLEDVTEVTESAMIEGILGRIQERLKCKNNASLDALMRLPDTFNNKLVRTPVQCIVKFINANFRYSLGDFKDITGQVRIAPTKSAVKFEPKTLVEPVGEIHVPIKPDRLYEDTRLQTKRAQLGEETTHDSYDQDANQIGGGTIQQKELKGRLPLTSHQHSTTGLGLPPLPETSIHSVQVVRQPQSVQHRVFQRLLDTGEVVELALKGSDQIIKGKLEWMDKEWVGILDGEDQYAIPVSAILFLRYKE